MSVTLFDCQCGFGGAGKGSTAIVSAQELADEMRRVGISRSLARIIPEDYETDVATSNAKLYAACEGVSCLVPCPVVFPGVGPDRALEEGRVDECIRGGAGAVWLRPQLDYWLLAEWASGKLFGVLEERRLPTMCLERMIGFELVAGVAKRYPKLPIILVEASYRSQRTLIALMEAFSNIYFSIGAAYTVHKGIEQLVETVGPERLLFGTGFPAAEPAAAIAQLMYADISEEEKQLVGSLNLERLTGGIVR